MEINSTKRARPYIWKTNQPLCFFIVFTICNGTCMQRHANRQLLWHFTVKGWLYQQQILKIWGKVKNAKPKKSKETCPYCLGRKHQFCTLCKEAGLRLKRWAGGKMNDNLAPTKSGMNVTGGWVQEVHLVKTQKSVWESHTLSGSTT